MLLSMMILYWSGCSSTKIKYHQPIYYEFNLSEVELDPIEPLQPKGYVMFLDPEHRYVKMPAWFYATMLDRNDRRKKHIMIYRQLYEWALEDVERYNAFVAKQKQLFQDLNR